MPLYNIDDHRGCPYYATDSTSLFGLYEMTTGSEFTVVDSDRHMLVYVMRGKVRIHLGHYPEEPLCGGSLMFVPKNIGFLCHTEGSCSMVTSYFTRELPLCDKYELVDLLSELESGADKALSPPPMNFRK